MTGILIIDDMPSNCYECDYCCFVGYGTDYCGRSCLLTREYVQTENFEITKSRHKSCPLKPIVIWGDEINIIDEEQEKNLREGEEE